MTKNRRMPTVAASAAGINSPYCHPAVSETISVRELAMHSLRPLKACRDALVTSLTISAGRDASYKRCKETPEIVRDVPHAPVGPTLFRSEPCRQHPSARRSSHSLRSQLSGSAAFTSENEQNLTCNSPLDAQNTMKNIKLLLSPNATLTVAVARSPTARRVAGDNKSPRTPLTNFDIP